MAEATHGQALRLENLEAAFPGPFGLGRRTVLEGVSLSLDRGEMLGLVGPNGSGKTTLLRVVAGLERARTGTVRVLGGSPAETVVRRRIGFLSEVSPFPPELKAHAALDLFASLSGLPRSERLRRVPMWLERVGLYDAAQVPLGRFSKGMLRRFGLAQALFHEPHLVLLDEPTAGLDALGMVLYGELVDEALERGAAVIVASHMLGDLLQRARELAVLVEGRLVARGAPEALVAGASRVRLELEDADDAALASIEAYAREVGVRVLGRGPGSNALFEIYSAATDGPRSG